MALHRSDAIATSPRRKKSMLLASQCHHAYFDINKWPMCHERWLAFIYQVSGGPSGAFGIVAVGMPAHFIHGKTPQRAVRLY